VADSFSGMLPPDRAKYPADAWDLHHRFNTLAVSREQVESNFEKYGLLDEQVRFLEGWFKDTLPGAPIDKLAVARLDGDMYESTMDGLTSLYPKLSIGGYLIVDDYGAVPACAKAVEDYRQRHDITDPINVIDWTGVFWQRTK
jgi:O-methyltransferase